MQLVESYFVSLLPFYAIAKFARNNKNKNNKYNRDIDLQKSSSPIVLCSTRVLRAVPDSNLSPLWKSRVGKLIFFTPI